MWGFNGGCERSLDPTADVTSSTTAPTTRSPQSTRRDTDLGTAGTAGGRPFSAPAAKALARRCARSRGTHLQCRAHGIHSAI